MCILNAFIYIINIYLKKKTLQRKLLWANVAVVSSVVENEICISFLMINKSNGWS